MTPNLRVWRPPCLLRASSARPRAAPERVLLGVSSARQWVTSSQLMGHPGFRCQSCGDGRTSGLEKRHQLPGDERRERVEDGVILASSCPALPLYPNHPKNLFSRP